MQSRIDPHLLLMFLYTQLESLDDLAILMWLGRQAHAWVDAVHVAKAVDVDEDQAEEALEHFARVGLVERHEVTGRYRYALEFALPSDLAHSLGAQHAANRLN